MAYLWQCPFCSHHTTINDDREQTLAMSIDIDNAVGAVGDLVLGVRAAVCPNKDCRELYLQASLTRRNATGVRPTETTVESWRLRPRSSAKPLPSYVPRPIRQDYEEAHLIRELSPKASATLARRCLQGMIRDFWGIRKDRLLDEVMALQDKVDPAIWEAIHALRKLGNIGAHGEKEPYVIVDVEPAEAEALLKLIEILVADWYDRRETRRVDLEGVKAIAAGKDELKILAKACRRPSYDALEAAGSGEPGEESGSRE